MNLKKVRLEAIGHLAEPEALPEGQSIPDRLEKEALLVYSGQFESMDGPVEITDEHIEMLAGNHNSALGKLKRLATGEVPMKAYPPIQLDHSTSAMMTVGRLVGELTVGEQEVDGVMCKALMGKVRVLGAENVAKVMDGRWTHLSIGADLESGKINELTITPFPAAANASLLKKGDELARGMIDDTVGLSKEEMSAKMSKKTELFGNTTLDRQTFDLDGYPCAMNNEDGNFWAECSGQRVPGNFKTEASAQKNLKDFIKEFMSQREGEKELSRLAAGYKVGEGEKDGFGYLVLLTPDGYIGTLKDDMNSFTEIKRTPEEAIDMVDVLTQNKKAQMTETPKEDGMDKEKLKKHLMDKEQLSSEAADQKLSEMPDDKKEELSAEIEENEKKLAAEEEEKAKLEAEKEEETKELTAEEEEKEELSADPQDQEPKNEDLSPDKAKMSEAKKKFIQLTKDMRKTSSDLNLAAKKNQIHARLSALRSKGKISPAEIKKMDIAKLSASNEDTIKAVLSSYEAREPVVHIGVYGTAKAINLAKIASDQKMAALELESRLNMSMKKESAKATLEEQKSVMKRFSSEHALAEMPEKTEIHIDTTPHTHYEVLAKMLDEGKDKEEIKTAMKRMFDEYANKEGGQLSESAETSEAEMSTLAEKVKRLQTQFKELTEIVGPALGVKSKELSE